MEAVSLLEGELLENDTGQVLMENSEDSTRPEDQQLLSSRQVRSVYLLTYSQADVDVVPSREEFSRVVLDSFKNADPCSHCEVVQWVCSQELHKDGGIHYHMAVKLSARRRWLKVRNYMDDKFSVKVNFSNHHHNYYSAWQYTTKEDSSYLESPNHPDLTNYSEQTYSQGSRSRTRNASEHGNESNEGNRKRKRRRKNLSVYDVSQIAVQKGIKTRLELLVHANQQKNEGKTDLAEFIANRGSKAVDEALAVGWEMEEAEKKLERSKLSRTDILYREMGKECVDGCGRRWLHMAEDILQRNNIQKLEFAEAVRNLLKNGRGKYRNILLKGPANCGKTFLLNPLNVVFRTFTNPATTTFAWVGAAEAEVLFLNDFRWSPQIIPWHDLLLLLEGQEVHLPAPKTHYKQDISFKGDTPIFCTAKDELSYVRGGVLDQRETEMMRVRWVVYSLYSQIPEEEQVSVPACSRCFSELIFSQG